MSTSRYFQVVSKKIINELNKHYEKIEVNRIKADDLAKNFGFESSACHRFHLWDFSLSGFVCHKSEHFKRVDKEWWIIPKNSYTWPRKKKDSPYYAEYEAARKELKINSDSIDELIGFNSMSFFPTTPGFHINYDKNLVIFIMPESCNSVEGSKEISNIEYIKLTKD